jgi:hypothetical protein
MRYYLSLFCLLFFTIETNAQFGAPEGESTGEQVLYRNEMHGGAFLHTNGLGGFFRKGRHVTGKRMRFFEIEFLSMSHVKSNKRVNPFEESARQYVYGKQNSFAIIRPGIGFQNVLHGKDRRKGVSVRYHYFAGPSIGITKPVYLEIVYYSNTGRTFASEKYDPQRHHLDNIYGRAPFTKGLDELKIHPGVYGKFGLSFEYSGYDDVVRALETGIVIDAFNKDIPIMALTQNNQVFINFYISFVFGKREF